MARADTHPPQRPGLLWIWRQPGPSVTDFYASAASLIAEPRFLAAIAVAIISGLVRGFSGFGSALIYVPLIAAIYEPRIAALTLLIVDFTASAPYTVAQTRYCNWREVAPVSIAAVCTIPLGVAALEYLDPTILRWFIAILVGTLLLVLASGWRYRSPPTLPASIGVGLVAGVGAGAAQIAGPAAIIYWLGGPNSAQVIRANLMVYFAVLAIVSAAIYYVRGLFTADVLILSILLGPVFILAMAIGARMFRGASDVAYRRVAYAIIALSAIVSVPLFDELFR
ncbi:sulfite exporter TauE/SafE family protein [Pseudorhodoplanes sp.]|uniref:sulfite exporter TauE/SafE family protein n=1 Tax=Pseudorhodoplanes sp. TaxID=1934341 RepID=UPI002D196669|nr:sulfite exporter TauE/SafE family protein [Pseudorhodoplanes sp.]HWV42204.1 sulfite exporter TauE/SafE family protein [Pseudorhodoplanes sp.]